MFKEQSILFLYTESPLHAGSGASVGSIDLPIQRENVTKFPIIQSSGIKGALRDLARSVKEIKKSDFASLKLLRDKNNLTDEEVAQKEKLENKIVPFEIVFGPETDRAHEHGGALAFTDAHLLLFPVRSFAGVFAWVTCPMVLDRFKRELKRVNSNYVGLDNINFSYNDYSTAFVGATCINKLLNQDKLILEDIAFISSNSNVVDQLAEWISTNALPSRIASQYWATKLRHSLVVVPDDIFLRFVTFSTDVVFRIQIAETGTVQEGALWSEERIPAETLFYTLSLATEPKINTKYLSNYASIMNYLNNDIITQSPMFQIGGNETVGCGLVQTKLLLSSHL